MNTKKSQESRMTDKDIAALSLPELIALAVRILEEIELRAMELS